MTEKITVELGNVQKTLFLPLWGRAHESKKEKPLLVDRTAQAMLDKVDYDFSNLAANLSPLTQVAWIMRSICVDKVSKDFLAKYPQATIVNIGCGLDTTFERVDNGRLSWYDLDLPDVIALRRKLVQESERRKFISGSFLEEDWTKEINAAQNAPIQQMLFIAAGVFYYFEADEIRQFLIRLADQFPGCEILFDASSPYGVKVANKMVIQSSGLDEKSFLKWGVEKPEEILAWDQRIRLLDTLYYFRGRAKLFPWKIALIGAFSDWMRIQYMIHLRLG
jgi:O-methyltransferase involved in polyketide biosynthesis